MAPLGECAPPRHRCPGLCNCTGACFGLPQTPVGSTWPYPPYVPGQPWPRPYFGRHRNP